MSEDTCPHCDHLWDNHDGLLTGSKACDVCGCMWQPPKPPESPPPPPTERELLIARVIGAIFDDLDRQFEADEIDAAGYWDREWGRVDGEPDWGAIAAAVIRAVEEPEELS